MFPDRCNFSCKYCLRNADVNQSNISETISDSFIQYIKKLTSMRTSKQDALLVMFWGGEPLLHLDSIKKIISRLSGEKIKYAIVTNGRLLTEDIVQFLNKNDISCTISTDGKYSDKTRGYNVLEDDHIVSLIKQCKNVSFNSVLSSYNQNFYDLWNYIDTIMGRETTINFEELTVSWDMPSDLYNYDFDKFKSHIRELSDAAFDKLINGEFSRELSVIYSYIKDLAIMSNINEINDKDLYQLIMPTCHQVLDMISIDTSGNVYACHNDSIPIGTAQESLNELYTKYKKFILESYKNRPDCLKCDYLYFCHGRCPYATPSYGKEQTCKIHKIILDESFRFLKKVRDFEIPIDFEEENT